MSIVRISEYDHQIPYGFSGGILNASAVFKIGGGSKVIRTALPQMAIVAFLMVFSDRYHA
jgi:hypothetical protein